MRSRSGVHVNVDRADAQYHDREWECRRTTIMHFSS
jgi:hypothetical protein